MSGVVLAPGELVSTGIGAAAAGSAPVALGGNFPMALSLTNYHTTAAVAPVVTIGMAFAQGDIPAGSSLAMTSNSTSAAIQMQEDAIASWGDGSRKFSALSFTSPDTFGVNGSGTATKNYTLSVSSSPPNTTPAFTLAAFIAANDIKVVFTGFDCGSNTFVCDFNQIVSTFAASPWEGQFALASAVSNGATTLPMVSAAHISKAMTVSGPGIPTGCVVASVSGNTVTISAAVTSGISAGVPLEFGSPLGGWETLCSGPNCLEWKAWSYLYCSAGPNVGAFHTQVKCTLYVRAWGVNGPHEIYAQLMIPNVYGNIAGGTVGPSGVTSKRFICNATVQNGSSVLYYFGGANDSRAFTVSASDFNSDGSITIASPPNWLHMNTYGGVGVSFSSTGTLPGDLSASTACWLVATGTTSNAYMFVWRLIATGSNSGTWAANTTYPGDTIVFSDSGTYATYNGGTSGTVAPAGAGPVTDGTVTWVRLSAANFTTAGTGTITLMPTLAVFPFASVVLASASGEPIWSAGSSGITSRPHLMPSYNQNYLCQKTKFTPPYDLSKTTYSRSSYDIINNGAVANFYSEFSPSQSQPWGFIISTAGDNPGDERVGYFSSSNAYSIYQQTDPITDLIIRSEALGFADYPYVLHNEKSGQPPITNAGPDRNPQGRQYPGLGPIDLTLTATSLNQSNGCPATTPMQFGPDWCGHQITYGPLIDEQHMPLLFSTPYLRTGHRIYLDNAILLASTVLLTTAQRSMNVGERVFWGSLAEDNTGQIRGIAWRIKVVAQSNHMMPDSHLVKPFFADWLTDTARYFQAYFPLNMQPPQAAPLGIVGVYEQNAGNIPAYMYSFLGLVVAIEAWRDAIDNIRPEWKDWLTNYASRFFINVFDIDQGGGMYNLPQGNFAIFGFNPANVNGYASACVQTVSAFWQFSFNVQDGAVNAPGLGQSSCTSPNGYPYNTNSYDVLWACAIAAMAWVGVPKAAMMFSRYKTIGTTSPCSGILWAQNGTNAHYDLNTAQSYMPWCIAPSGQTMP